MIYDERRDDEFRREVRVLLLTEGEPLAPGLILRMEAGVRREARRLNAMSPGEGLTVTSILLVLMSLGGVLNVQSVQHLLTGALLALVYFLLIRWKFRRVATDGLASEIGRAPTPKERPA